MAALLTATVAGVGSVIAAPEATVTEAPLRRLAIVIGNSNYRSEGLPKLPNSLNDAARLSEAMQALKFDVVTVKDATADDMAKLLEDQKDRLKQYSAVVFFYAGHGVQVNGENYLLPVDTPEPESAAVLTQRAVKLNDLIVKLSDRDRQTLIFLDACRNSPMAGTQKVGGDGLAQVEVGENTFVAFATKPGDVTFDGTQANSPFTTALLASIQTPGLSISDTMLAVRNKTEELTVGRQTPWEQSNLLEQFYFTAQQYIAPTQLTTQLEWIMRDPALRAQARTLLAADVSLQEVIIRLGGPETVRSISGTEVASVPSGTAVAASPSVGVGTEIPIQGLNTTETVAHPQADITAIISTLFAKDSASDAVDEEAKEITRNVQKELRRLGCYRNKVDGDWGKGSVRALDEYYRRAKIEPSAREPSANLLASLSLRSGRLCPEPVVKPKPQTVASSGDRPQGGGRTVRGGGASTAPKRVAPPPPDISGGIGIGGIF